MGLSRCPVDGGKPPLGTEGRYLAEGGAMKVKFFAYIRDYTGTKAIDMEAVPDVYTLIHELSDRYGKDFRGVALAPGGETLGDEIIILVNGRHVEHLNGIHTPLVPSDTVAIFPVVAGG
ncbi:MAG: MoaD family protein [Eubacterium sp.]